MSETVNSFGNISNPCTVAFPAFKKNKTHFFGKTENTGCCWKKCA